MAEFRVTVRIPSIDPSALADTAEATANIAEFRDAVAGIAVAELTEHDELALLAAQRRVSSRWSVLATDIAGSTGVAASVDLRLLDLPDSLLGADVDVMTAFTQGVVAGVIGWVNSGPGAAIKALAGGNVSGLKFDDEFLAGVTVARA